MLFVNFASLNGSRLLRSIHLAFGEHEVAIAVGLSVEAGVDGCSEIVTVATGLMGRFGRQRRRTTTPVAPCVLLERSVEIPVRQR